MKYVLVDKGDNIIENVVLDSEVGVSGARTYFLKSKGIDRKEFDNMWKVMSQNQYDIQFKSTLQNRQIEWWKDDENYLDIDK